MRAPLEREELAAALAHQARGRRWRTRLSDLAATGSRSALHVAVMREPYLDYVLTGRKTIESRFSLNRVAPFGAVARGDILVFKAQSGPALAVALADHAASYELEPNIVESLRARFSAPLCADDDSFWFSRRRARYATLVHLTDVETLRAPLALAKRDRRGWVCLPPAELQLPLRDAA